MSLHSPLIIALCLSLLGGSACAPAADPKGRETAAADTSSVDDRQPEVIGTVNGRPLYKSFYEQNLSFIETRLSKDVGSADVERYLNARFEAFDMLVQDELLSEEAQRQGIGVTDEEVQAELARSAQASGGESIFLASLKARGMGRRQALEGIRRKLIVDRFVKEKLQPGITVTDDESIAYYNAHLDRFTPEAWVKASHIFIGCPGSADEDRVRKAREHAEKILRAIRGGASFEEMARQHSEDGTASMGGSLGRMKKGYAPEAFDKVAFSLPPGQVSDVVQTDKGFHIIKVTDRFGGAPRPYQEVADVCRKNVQNQKQATAIEELMRRLKSQAQIVSQLP